MNNKYDEHISISMLNDINEALGFIESSEIFGLNEKSMTVYKEHCYGKDKMTRVNYIIHHLSEFGKFLSINDAPCNQPSKVMNIDTGQRVHFTKLSNEDFHRFIRVEFTFHSGLSKDTILQYVKDNRDDMLESCHELMTNHSVWQKNNYTDDQYFLNTGIMTTCNTVIFEFVRDRRAHHEH